MTNSRTPVSAPQNIWSDAQAVDDISMDLEQNHNNIIEAGIINNHVGDGVLPETLIPNVIFDSTNVTGFLDGVWTVSMQNAVTQPSDNNLGNQLQIALTGSEAAGNRTVKIVIIGLDFQDNLQYETFRFKVNEAQVSHRHFAKILAIFFNDFIGNPLLSLNLGGRIVITEVSPLTISRDPIMVAQDQQPNLFFRDFFVDNGGTLTTLLQSALPLYNIASLNIYSSELDNLVISAGDVTTQIGEKFLAATDNIQKVTLLLSVQNLTAGQQNNLAFTGNLVVSVYPLQSTLTCSTDIAPALPIDFAPSNIPLVQVSDGYASLAARGIVLNSVPQPVDFYFNNSPIATSGALTIGQYYAVALTRSGSDASCDILIATGQPLIANSRVTTFAGTLWVDLPDQQLWFQVWTDAAKISDGQAYDSGNGIIIPKTTTDPTTQATIDYSMGDIVFAGGDVFSAVVSAVTLNSAPVPDQRTGNPVDTVQQFVPQVQLLNTINLTNLEQASEPLIVGAISDKNIDFIDEINSLLQSSLYSATMVNNQLLVRIVDDPTDTVRFNSTVTALATALLNGAFVGAQFFPNFHNPNISYRIAQASLCSQIVGDVDGNGIIDYNDLNLLNTYLGYNLNLGLPYNSEVTTNGSTTTYVNGYTLYTNPFTNGFNLSFQVVDPNTNVVVASASDGVLVPFPTDPTHAQFTSNTVDFNSIVGLSTYVVVILPNYGGFSVVGIDPTADVITLQKIFLTGDVFAQMFSADIDGDFYITANDGYLLESYIQCVPNSAFTPQPVPYPGPTTNAYAKIGTRFNVVRFTLEQFIDRADDYSSLILGRPSVVHPLSDIFTDGYNAGYFAGQNFYTDPSQLAIQELLTWDSSLITTNSNPRFVPTIFSSLTGLTVNSCNVDGITCNVYPVPLDFDPGTIDCFVPNNLILGPGGELMRPTGDFYKVDFEVGTVVLEIPDGLFGTERTIDILNDFIVSTVDGSGNQTGRTTLGFPAMKFSDCSFVTPTALADDQLRFSVSVQSFSPNTNGLSPDGYYGAIVDGKMGVNIDYATGLLTLNFTNLYQDPVLQTLSTKVQVNVFLKRGGFNNAPLFVDSTQVQNMLSLISIFSGANVGGVSALVNLATDVTGILPVVDGGTGLDGYGPAGTVLTSNGDGTLYYGFPATSTSGLSANRPAAIGAGSLYLCTDIPVMYFDNPATSMWQQFATEYMPAPLSISNYTTAPTTSLIHPNNTAGIDIYNYADAIRVLYMSPSSGSMGCALTPATLTNTIPWMVNLTCNVNVSANLNYPDFGVCVTTGTVSGTSVAYAIAGGSNNSGGNYLHSEQWTVGGARTSNYYESAGVAPFLWGTGRQHYRLLNDSQVLHFQFSADGFQWQDWSAIQCPTGLTNYGFFAAGGDGAGGNACFVNAMVYSNGVGTPAQYTVTAANNALQSILTIGPHTIQPGDYVSVHGAVGNTGINTDTGGPFTNFNGASVLVVAVNATQIYYPSGTFSGNGTYIPDSAKLTLISR